MNKRYFATLVLLSVALTSCGAKPLQDADTPPPAVSQETTTSQEPQQPAMPDMAHGTWQLRDADYQRPTQKDRFDAIEIPNDTGCSLVLLNVATGEETVLLSGTDGHSYACMGWIDETHLLCFDEERTYYLCSVGGEVIQLEEPFESQWGPVGFQYSVFVEQVGQELRLVHITRDGTGTVTELARAPFEGGQVTTCAMIEDGSYVCCILQKDMTSFDRYILLWETATGRMAEIEPPQMTVGEGNMRAVRAESWYSSAFTVEFYVADAPEPDEHNELWLYRCEALDLLYGEIDSGN